MPSSHDLQGHFTIGELKLASFWVRNRLLIRRLGYGSLIGLSVLLWGYVLWSLVDAYAISYQIESRIPRDIALNQERLTALDTDVPEVLAPSSVSVFRTLDNRMDLVVELTNPNAMWWVEFNYRFSVSGEETPIRSGYSLPNGRQILTELGYRPKSAGGLSATLLLDNVRWHRIDPSLLRGTYEDFAKQRFALTFKDITYDTDIVLGTRPVGQSSFTLVNKSSYGLWNVDLVVRLYRGPSFVAVNKITITNVHPGEERPLKMVWIDNLPGVTKTEIIPQANLLDPNLYLPTKYFE